MDSVRHIGGIRAIVLGGSRGRGTHTPSSDYDLCFYYYPDQPLDLNALNQAASRLDDTHRESLLTPLGGWGPWINGGGWLTVQSQAVDFLYRDLSRVHAVVDDCLSERVEIVYQPGHPFGFITSIYMAEAALCQPLWDPYGEVSALKARTWPYPAALQRALIEKFAWEIGFSLDIARKSVSRQDVTYAAGCCFRSVACMLQVLFARNGEYWLNEKGALALTEAFTLRPKDFKNRVESVFEILPTGREGISRAVDMLAELAQEFQAF